MNIRKDNMLNVMAMGLRITLPILLFIVMGCAGVSTVKDYNPEEDSFVIGRVQDRVIITQQELYDLGYRGETWRIDEFELFDASYSKATKIRMTHDGYFIQKMDPGAFVFQLNIGGTGYTPSSREEGAMELKACNVPHNSIVNIGTFIVTTNLGGGVPLNNVVFTVRPINSSESFSDPLSWFKNKNPDVADAYGDRIINSE